MTVQPQNNNLNYLIYPTVTNDNRLFVLSFQIIAGENSTTKDRRHSFSHYYLPNVRMKDFNVLIDGKSFFNLLGRNEEQAYEKIMGMSNNDDYTTGNLLDFAYFEKRKKKKKKNYKLIAIDLSKQTKLKDPQQNSFISRILAARVQNSVNIL